MTLLAVNGGPWRGRGGNRAVTVPQRAPHTAPGSDQPLVAGPCTASNKERPGRRGARNRSAPRTLALTHITGRGPHPWLPGETHRTGTSRKRSLHDTAPYQIPKEGAQVCSAPHTQAQGPAADTRPPHLPPPGTICTGNTAPRGAHATPTFTHPTLLDVRGQRNDPHERLGRHNIPRDPSHASLESAGRKAPCGGFSDKWG